MGDTIFGVVRTYIMQRIHYYTPSVIGEDRGWHMRLHKSKFGQIFGFSFHIRRRYVSVSLKFGVEEQRGWHMRPHTIPNVQLLAKVNLR